jgi:hypothetical protein
VDWFKHVEHTGDVVEQHIGKLTARCFENGRPHDRVIDDCDAAQFVDEEPSRPSSVSLRPIRRGSITYQINPWMAEGKVE